MAGASSVCAWPTSARSATPRATSFITLLTFMTLMTWLQEALASLAAPAHDHALTVGVVVVGELLTLLDHPRGADPDDPLLDVDVAVGPAGVVDEPRVVAAHPGIDHRAVRELEAPDVAGLHVPDFALQAHLIGNLLAGVVDDAFVLRNGFGCIHAPSMDA